MTSQLCAKLRSFAQLIFHPDCLSYQQTDQALEGTDLTLQDNEQEQERRIPNGNLPQESILSTSRFTEDHAVPLHCVGSTMHNHGGSVASSTRTRLQSDSGGSSTTVSSSKQVQNIYRKPISRIGSNPSLRRTREPHFRCAQRLSRQFQMFDSDPGDIYCYYSPSGSTQLHQRSNDRPSQSYVEDEAPAQGPSYRRRVYTMPSVPSRGVGQKAAHSSRTRDSKKNDKNIDFNLPNTENTDAANRIVSS